MNTEKKLWRQASKASHTVAMALQQAESSHRDDSAVGRPVDVNGTRLALDQVVEGAERLAAAAKGLLDGLGGAQ